MDWTFIIWAWAAGVFLERTIREVVCFSDPDEDWGKFFFSNSRARAFFSVVVGRAIGEQECDDGNLCLLV